MVFSSTALCYAALATGLREAFVNAKIAVQAASLVMEPTRVAPWSLIDELYTRVTRQGLVSILD